MGKKHRPRQIPIGILLQVTPHGGAHPFVGVVTGKNLQEDGGLWAEYVDDKGALQTQYISPLDSVLQIPGYRGEHGIRRHYAKQSPLHLARIQDQIQTQLLTQPSLKEMLGIATQHVEHRYSCKDGIDAPAVFQMGGYGFTNTDLFFGMLYKRLVQRPDSLGFACRQLDGASLSHLIMPSFEEALECFRVCPTPAMAELISLHYWERIGERTPTSFIAFDLFEIIADPRNRYMKESTDTDVRIGRILAGYLLNLPGPLLQALVHGRIPEEKDRIAAAVKRLSPVVVDTLRTEYDKRVIYIYADKAKRVNILFLLEELKIIT